MIRIRRDAYDIGLAAVVSGVLLGGCSFLGPIQVDTARTGETVVRVARAQALEDLASHVYGDSSFAAPIAEIAGLDPRRAVPAGTLLVLPARDDLENRLRGHRQGEDLYQRGLQATDAGRWQEASDLFRRALELSPQRLDARYNLGLALLRAGEVEEATGVLEAVAAARPEDPDSRYAFGTVLRRRRAWDRAMAEFRATAGIDSRHAPARFAIARTLEDLGRDRDAVREWNRFLRDFPGDELEAPARRRLTEAEDRLREGAGP